MFVVTGGAGFIGSALISGLNSLGFYDIVIVDRLGSADKWLNLRKLRFRAVVHKDKFFSWLDSCGRIDYVFHLGACSSTTERDVDYLLANNVDFSQRLLCYCAQRGISISYASSAATYGLGEAGFGDDESKLSLLRPINPYGWSKQLVDMWISDPKTPKPPSWIGLKFFNVFGPNEYHKGSMKSLVAKIFPEIQKNKPVGLFKSYKPGIDHGQQRRDFIYIKDVVSIMLHVFNNHSSLDSGIYNVGTGTARTFEDLALASYHALDLPPQIEWIEMPEALRSQYQYFTAADTKKLRTSLAYSASMTSLEDAIKDYALYLKAKDPYL